METILLILLAFGGLTGIGVAGVFGLALVGRMRADPGSPTVARQLGALTEQLAETRAEVARLSESDDQFRDLAERVEFLERLLQRAPPQEDLPPPE